eukprot:5835697-Pleurochrysis_carterae.AAC.1
MFAKGQVAACQNRTEEKELTVWRDAADSDRTCTGIRYALAITRRGSRKVRRSPSRDLTVDRAQYARSKLRRRGTAADDASCYSHSLRSTMLVAAAYHTAQRTSNHNAQELKR